MEKTKSGKPTNFLVPCGIFVAVLIAAISAASTAHKPSKNSNVGNIALASTLPEQKADKRMILQEIAKKAKQVSESLNSRKVSGKEAVIQRDSLKAELMRTMGITTQERLDSFIGNILKSSFGNSLRPLTIFQSEASSPQIFDMVASLD